MIPFKLTVRIPGILACVAAAKKLHKPNTLFHKAPGQQAVTAEVFAGWVIHAVEFPRGLGFLRQIHHLGCLALHAKCQFIRGDARSQLRFDGVLLRMVLIERFDEI